MTKLEELEKRKDRLESEADKAEQQAKKYQETAKQKRQESKRVEAEMLSETLVQSGMTLSDLQELIGIKNNSQQHEQSEGEV